MKEKIKEMQELPERQPMPNITPEMIQSTFKILETHGMLFYKKGAVYVPTEKGWKLLTKVKSVREEIIAYGHPNIVATNESMIKLTKSEEPEDDSVIGVKANKTCVDLRDNFKEQLKNGKKVKITLNVDGIEEEFSAYGSPALKLTSNKELIIRKSDIIDEKTLAIMADKSAREINREIIKKLNDPKTEIRVTLEIFL